MTNCYKPRRVDAHRACPPKTSAYRFSHFADWSSTAAESTKRSGKRLSGVSTRRLVGTNSRDSRSFYPSTPSTNSYHSSAARGCGARADTASPLTRAIAGGSTNQSIGAPLFFNCSAL